jgi:hypothetical protein
MIEDLGLGLPGVESFGDLIPFQRLVLRVAAEKRAEQMKEQSGMKDSPGGASPHGSGELNSRYQPGGGGRKVVTKHYSNLSAETGADPEEIVARYRKKKGLDSDS